MVADISISKWRNMCAHDPAGYAMGRYESALRTALKGEAFKTMASETDFGGQVAAVNGNLCFRAKMKRRVQVVY